ncbi:hypothetical protein EDEG_01686 [Edhazardia aedis USNM 41457]|uniref:PPPDE domain-containing protein n=1 Tax=Edhazardia aedis (strain USNM 41457) TaxID=1003232 RepID=J9D8B6_EDHAE|nr:hypothetical protein EDEG_01686 [Edhazardia aedis USNM 41457]|eukprot:EJW04021.1 hypothetical protein EDEG_01686 [Edhazardia aedis USNM 41457]
MNKFVNAMKLLRKKYILPIIIITILLNYYKRKNHAKYPVFLRVYDLSKGKAAIFSEPLFGYKIDGVWHTSIEVHDKEIWFGKGITHCKPGESSHGAPIKRIEMGLTKKSPKALEKFIKSVSNRFHKQKYHLLKNNCNHFSNELALFLVNENIPDYIINLADEIGKNPKAMQMLDLFKIIIE